MATLFLEEKRSGCFKKQKYLLTYNLDESVWFYIEEVPFMLRDSHFQICFTLAWKFLLLLLQIVPRPAEGAATTGLIERQRVYKSCPFLKDKST